LMKLDWQKGGRHPLEAPRLNITLNTYFILIIYMIFNNWYDFSFVSRKILSHFKSKIKMFVVLHLFCNIIPICKSIVVLLVTIY